MLARGAPAVDAVAVRAAVVASAVAVAPLLRRVATVADAAVPVTAVGDAATAAAGGAGAAVPRRAAAPSLQPPKSRHPHPVAHPATGSRLGRVRVRLRPEENGG